MKTFRQEVIFCGESFHESGGSMSLPGALTKVTITGTYVDASGAAQSGTVSFTPTSTVTDAAGSVVLTQTAVVAELSSGSFSLGPLVCTDNQNLAPAGWAYVANVAVGGAQQTISPVYLSHALGSTVDMSQITTGPAAPAPSGLIYLPNAVSPPSGGPSLGGGFLYALNGALYWQGPSGSPALIAPA
jgi:hypothetical protein